jgi:hypothetical protein
MTAKAVYERQEALLRARHDVGAAFEAVWYALEPGARERTDANAHPDVVAARERAEALGREVVGLHEAIGGKVYRVVTVKLAELEERIARLNKKAAKLGTGAITLTVTDEREEVVRKVPRTLDQEVIDIYGVEATHREEVVTYVYVILAGETPMVPGFVFMATLDHTASQGHEDEAVGIRRVPALRHHALSAEAIEAIDAADLAAYRHVENKCDHCGYVRQRLQTYLLYEVEGGAIRQVGSTCLRDYTGANSPERVAAWAEWLAALDHDLTAGEDGFGDVEFGGGRVAIGTTFYLAHVAAVMRESGWRARWARDEYSGESVRQQGTADWAHSNIANYGKSGRRGESLFVEVTDTEWAEAAEALEWVREDLGEREELDEFQHNLVTYCRSDYLPEKGDGFVAYAVMALRREREKALLAEKAAGSEWIGAVKERIKALTFTVTFVKPFEGHYGTRFLTKGYTPEGNLILWWAGRELEAGKTYTGSATIKKLTTDSYSADAKVSEVTNVRGIKEAVPA